MTRKILRTEHKVRKIDSTNKDKKTKKRTHKIKPINYPVAKTARAILRGDYGEDKFPEFRSLFIDNNMEIVPKATAAAKDFAGRTADIIQLKALALQRHSGRKTEMISDVKQAFKACLSKDMYQRLNNHCMKAVRRIKKSRTGAQ